MFRKCVGAFGHLIVVRNNLIYQFCKVWSYLIAVWDQANGRGMSNNCVGEQNSNYLRRKTKPFDLLHRCSTYLRLWKEIDWNRSI